MGSSTSARFSPGEVLRGKYRIKRVLGEGGMGVVVRATHLRLDQDVAIKMLRDPASATGGARKNVTERFAREARAAARLKGIHAVRILDVDDDADDEPFLVMEYLEGSDLDRLVRKNGPLPAPRAVDYALQICEGLAEAHALGIVHRDVKPANIFLAKTPRGGEVVKILDFGISKASEAKDPTITEHERILGSPAFMSPEQLKSARDVDARSDVWSLGVVLYFLLSGKLPFIGDDATAVAARIASEEPKPLPSETVTPELSHVVMQCLVKDRDARLESVAAVARALAPFAASDGDNAAKRVSSVLRMPVASPSASASASSEPIVVASTMALPTPRGNSAATASLEAPIANALDLNRGGAVGAAATAAGAHDDLREDRDESKLTASLDAPGPVSLGVVGTENDDDDNNEEHAVRKGETSDREKASVTKPNRTKTIGAALFVAAACGVVWFATRSPSVEREAVSDQGASEPPLPLQIPTATVVTQVPSASSSSQTTPPTLAASGTPPPPLYPQATQDAGSQRPIVSLSGAPSRPPAPSSSSRALPAPSASTNDPLRLDIK